ncbi:MAG TPA: hypothetical protein VLM91_08185 [Candidatus Methylomirabilis sp.]|nr:hypothetical protein [Candidatus Methylomirabilis sp.]
MTGKNGLPAAPQRQHPEFHLGLIWAALASAIIGGFGIGGHLAFVIGFGFPLGRSFAALIQAHGHAQLVGWAGLFVMGTSLHFIPRLASVPLARPRWLGVILWMMAAGLLLRVLGQPALAYVGGGSTRVALSWVVVGSGCLEGAGVLLYVSLLIRTLRGSGDIRTQPAFGAVRPYFAMMLSGWLLYAGLNLLLLFVMEVRGSMLLDQAWDQFAVQLFLGLTLLPVAMAHSVRLFPMVLALSAAFWPVRETAYAYLLGVVLELVPTALSLLGLDGGMIRSIVNLGTMVKGSAILWFVWELDVLTRRRPVERPARFLQSGPDRPPTRPGLPDYGEFGRFERLLYSAYSWLALAAVCDIVDGGATLAGYTPPFTADPVRHMYLLGFITLLIIGVAVRMLPGFLKKKAVASPALVEMTFWLGNTAAVFRVLPLIVPERLLGLIPGGTVLAQATFGLSGLIGLAAVVCLAANLWQTARLGTS